MMIIVSAGKTRSQDRPVGLKCERMRTAKDGCAWIRGCWVWQKDQGSVQLLRTGEHKAEVGKL